MSICEQKSHGVIQKCGDGCGLPDIAFGSVHDPLSADLLSFDERLQFLVAHIVDLDHESIVGGVPPESEPPQAHQHVL